MLKEVMAQRYGEREMYAHDRPLDHPRTGPNKFRRTNETLPPSSEICQIASIRHQAMPGAGLLPFVTISIINPAPHPGFSDRKRIVAERG